MSGQSILESASTTTEVTASDTMAARPSRGEARTAGQHLEISRRRTALFRRSLALADMVSISLALGAAVAVGAGDELRTSCVVVPLVFVFVVKALGLYDRDEHLLHRSTLDEVPALFGISTLAVLLLWLGNGAIVEGEFNRGQILVAWSSVLLALITLRSLARAVATSLAPVERCLLVGDPFEAEFVREKLNLSSSVKAELVGVAGPVERSPDGEVLPPSHLGEMVSAYGVERVILAAQKTSREDILYMIRELKTLGVQVSVLPEASRVAGSSVELDHLHGMTLLGMRRFEFTRSSKLIKRSFDVVGASLGLFALSPVFLATALAIKFDSPGRVLFRQRRVGRNGEVFHMLKFRSMVNEAELMKDDLRHLNSAASGLFKIPADPRVTRVGAVIRKWQLDELPQLFNVLRGEMSLVGPRPLIPSEDRQIEGWYRRRLDVPPGITGHWQILGSSARISLDEMVKLDYLYVANWSLWNDIKLVLRTIPFVIGRRGV